MLQDGLANRLFVRTFILLLQWHAPLCAGYVAYITTHSWPHWPLNTPWRVYCFAESVWYLFMVWYIQRLQMDAKHPPMRTPKTRNELFQKVYSEIDDPEKFLSGWFRGWDVDEIGRNELRTFLDWAFWDGNATERDQLEIDEYVTKLETMLGRPFRHDEKGRAKALRLTLDPIEMETRTLLWYGLVMLVDALSFVALWKRGFQYHRTSLTSFAVFPPRPLAIAATDTSVSKRLSYWFRPHSSKTRLPVLYIHGIGLGLISQVDFLHELDTALNGDRGPDDQVGIIALEVLQVSTRLTHSILRQDEFRAELRSILDYYGWNRFVLACHSYGSVLSSHILTDQHLPTRISSVLLVDPVTILLHMPQVAFNFTVRLPKRANEWQLQLASKDPMVAHTLGRHLFWSETVLWRSRILQLIDEAKIRFTVSLASDDLIVDTAAVGAYVMHGTRPDPVLADNPMGREQMELVSSSKDDTWKRRSWDSTEPLNIIWWQGYDHAQCYGSVPDRAKLVEVIVEYCKGT